MPANQSKTVSLLQLSLLQLPLLDPHPAGKPVFLSVEQPPVEHPIVNQNNAQAW
jgi:hypothetical protein